MKKLLLTAAAGMYAFCVLAEDPALVLQVKLSGSSDPVNYELAGIERITFDGDVMEISDDNGTEHLNLRDIERMVFATLSGVDEIRDFDLGEGLEIHIRQGVLCARQEGCGLTLRIYDMNGRCLDSAYADSELTYPLHTLAGGTYVILVNDRAVKFIR